MKRAFISFPRSEPWLYEDLAPELMDRGVDVFRVDDIVSGSNWQAEILSAIRRADFVIAHIGSEKHNPNVLLEIGYAIGAGKPVVLLSDGPSEIPLDISTLPVFVPRKIGYRVVDEIIDFVSKLSPRTADTPPPLASAAANLRAALERADGLEQLSPAEFEELIAGFFTELGFQTEHFTGPNDLGVDLVIRVPDIQPIAVVVKKYASQSRLGIAEVQRMVGASIVAGIESVFMITTGGFTNSAREFAHHAPLAVHLLTLAELLDETKSSITKKCTGVADGP